MAHIDVAQINLSHCLKDEVRKAFVDSHSGIDAITDFNYTITKIVLNNNTSKILKNKKKQPVNLTWIFVHLVFLQVHTALPLYFICIIKLISIFLFKVANILGDLFSFLFQAFTVIDNLGKLPPPERLPKL